MDYPKKKEHFVDCIRCGHCCGLGRDSGLGDWSYMPGEGVPEGVETIEKAGEFMVAVGEDNCCAYMVKHNNGFTSCGIQGKKPRMCALYNCLTEKKAVYLGRIVTSLRGKCE